MLVFIIMLDLFVVEILPICRDLEILCIDVLGVYDMYTWRCMLYVRCVVVWIFMHVIFLENFGDVASISWINVAYFIALIEIRCYKYHNKEWFYGHKFSISFGWHWFEHIDLLGVMHWEQVKPSICGSNCWYLAQWLLCLQKGTVTV